MTEEVSDQLKAALRVPEIAAPLPLKDETVTLKRVGRPLRHVKNIPTKQLVFYSRNKEPQFTYDFPIKLPVKPKHVVVQVKSVGLNPVDLKIINSFTSNFNRERGIGREYSGVISHVGSKIAGSEWKEGDEVCGIYFHPNGFGTLSSSIDLDPSVDILVKKPTTLSFEKSGSWLFSFGSAYQILQKANKVDRLSSESSVFINGGSSSVGLMLIQLLKAFYKVEAITVSAAGSARDLVTNAGAKLVINYKVNPDLPKVLTLLTKTGVYKDFDDDGTPIDVREIPTKKFDLIIDCVGGYDLIYNANSYLKASSKGGQYISTVGDAKSNYAKDIYNDWNSVSMNARSFLGGAWGVNYSKFQFDIRPKNDEWLKDGVDMLESGEIDVFIEKIYNWKHHVEALNRLRTGHCHGKIVLNVEQF
jgi:NADPH:quinone reductase-like Zn-dependent oxidoreductase